MNIPRHAVKGGGILVVGLVAVGLAFGLLFSGPAQADGPHHDHVHPVGESTPTPTPTPAPTPASTMVTSPAMEYSVTFTETSPPVCDSWMVTVKTDVLGEYTNPTGIDPVQASDESHTLVTTCYQTRLETKMTITRVEVD